METLKLNFQITNIVPAELPTSLALPTAEVTDEKLENLYRDGTKLAFLKDSKMIGKTF